MSSRLAPNASKIALLCWSCVYEEKETMPKINMLPKIAMIRKIPKPNVAAWINEDMASLIFKELLVI